MPPKMNPSFRTTSSANAFGGAVIRSSGWNSAGMGQKHGFEQIEIMLCCHGGAHNDTICLAERRRPELQGTFL
jgi:hypothetical protein